MNDMYTVKGQVTSIDLLIGLWLLVIKYFKDKRDFFVFTNTSPKGGFPMYLSLYGSKQ